MKLGKSQVLRWKIVSFVFLRSIDKRFLQRRIFGRSEAFATRRGNRGGEGEGGLGLNSKNKKRKPDTGKRIGIETEIRKMKHLRISDTKKEPIAWSVRINSDAISVCSGKVETLYSQLLRYALVSLFGKPWPPAYSVEVMKKPGRRVSCSSFKVWWCVCGMQSAQMSIFQAPEVRAGDHGSKSLWKGEMARVLRQLGGYLGMPWPCRTRDSAWMVVGEYRGDASANALHILQTFLALFAPSLYPSGQLPHRHEAPGKNPAQPLPRAADASSS